jgi:SAM-dependent methyltransferase
MSRVPALRPRLQPWWRVRHAILQAWIAPAANAAPPGVVLKTDLFDEASGPHHHARGLREDSLFLGVDHDPGVVRQARDRLRSEGRAALCLVADVRRLPLAGSTIPLVISLSTLDHFSAVSEIDASLRELWRVLRPGSRLLLTLDNPANPEVALRRALPQAMVLRLRADAFFLGETLPAAEGSEALRASGFHVDSVRFLLHAVRYPIIRLLALLDRFLPSLLPRFERLVTGADILDRLPTRVFTGHYTAWIARKV